MHLIINKYIYLLRLLPCLLAALPCTAGAAFDQQHAAWTSLLKQHVVLIDGGKASTLRYGALARDRGALQAYLASLSSVPESEFKSWTRNEQLAFLINAYNAHMVELVLTRYPDIRSVWDFGKLLNNPFRKRFFRLLGRSHSLDTIEHETIRAKGRYDDPRIHMAVNCASVGCPMLREEAYVAVRLDAQLEDQVVRFLSDRSRNRYHAADHALEVSELFKWYREDFESGYRGMESREQFLAAYAAQLADRPDQQQIVRSRKAALRYLDYDWRLNDAKP